MRDRPGALSCKQRRVLRRLSRYISVSRPASMCFAVFRSRSPRGIPCIHTAQEYSRTHYSTYHHSDACCLFSPSSCLGVLFDITTHCGPCITGALRWLCAFLCMWYPSVPAVLSRRPRKPKNTRHLGTRTHGRRGRRQNIRFLSNERLLSKNTSCPN